MAAAKKKKMNKDADKKEKNFAAVNNTVKEENAAPAVKVEGLRTEVENAAPAEIENAVTENVEAEVIPETSEKTEKMVKAEEPGKTENEKEAETTKKKEGADAAPESKAVSEAAPVKPEAEKRVIKSSVQYSKSAEREKNIRKQVKKRKRRPVLLVLFLCSMLVLVAIVYNSITLEPESVEETPEEIDVPVTEIITPTPGPNDSQPEETEAQSQETVPAEENPEITPESTPEPVVEHSYQFFVEDISWEEARERCLELGGYLAVITSSEELEEIIEMAENNGVTHVWLGCHRVDGELVWEYSGDYYYQWDSGEPSAYDYNDDVAEDYLMFWEHNGGWYYNDSRNDPCGDYAAFYSGDMGYVCEFGSN